MLRRVCTAPLAAVGVSTRAVANMGNTINVDRVDKSADEALVTAAIDKAMKTKKKKANLRLIKDYKLAKKYREDEAAKRAAHKNTPNPFQMSATGNKEAPTPAHKNPRHVHIETLPPRDGMPCDGQGRYSEFEPRMVAMNISS